MTDNHQHGGASEDAESSGSNLMLLVAAALLIGAGIWLVDALLDARKADECMSAGRRNCTPVSTQPAR